ncbi:MAG TPA: type II secretion system secretin GspD [Burkholderiales bacterium]|nr:type II secretion system secretin GspD [Burkholderiales bacterium]
MNLKLKQLCLTLCGLSVINLSFAANTSSGTSSGNSSVSNTTSTSSQTADDKVVLNFENADIQTVIKAISKLSGKNFVVDPRVKGTVNIVSEKPVTKSESYKVLESALRMQGFATVEADGVIKVLPETDARTYGMKTDSQVSSNHSPGDQLITKIFTIDNGSATQLANALRPMISPNNAISVYPNSNSLVVTDYASNMSRITKIITDLKVTQATRVPPATVKLKYATAADVAQTLQSYLSGGSSSGGGGGSSGGNNDNGAAATITIDPSSNSIIIASTVSSRVEDLKRLAMSLDNQSANSHNNLHVVYLKNADAGHVAEVLRIIASGQDNPDLTASTASRALSDTSSVFQGSGSGSGGGSTPFGGGSANASSKSSPSRSGGGGGSSSTNNDKNAPKVLIQAEPTTNALIIQAPEQVYRNLRMVITLLDVRRVQIMIEALVAAVTTSEQGTFGIQWIGGAGNNNLGVGVVSNYAGNGSSASSLITSGMAIAQGASGSSTGGAAPSIPGEVYVGLVTGTTTIGGQTVPTISTLADMLASNSANNILGRPTLLTMDNEEAEIFVGQNIGIPTGSFQNSAAAPGSISSTVQRQDVGTILRIKPMITQNGTIQMTVYEEDSQTDTTGMTAALLTTNGPNINKRSIKTQIVVDDGQIIALGGMTQDVVQMQNSGIPVLSSIPYLGFLFSWQNRVHNKSNLVLFLRPVVIRNQEGYKALTNQRYSYMMDQQNMIQAKGNILFPQIDPVNLENQVPYDNQVPSQNTKAPTEPIVDLTSTAIKSGKTSLVSAPIGTVLNQPQQNSGTVIQPANGNSSSSNTRVIQNSPNSISIYNNN